MAAAGVTREALERRALRKPEAPRVLFEGRRFPTPTGRFQLIDDFPDAPPAFDAGYPLCLMSNASYRTQASQMEQSAQQEPPVVTVHPDAAAGRADGELATLASPLASVTVRLRFDPKQRRDVVDLRQGAVGEVRRAQHAGARERDGRGRRGGVLRSGGADRLISPRFTSCSGRGRRTMGTRLPAPTNSRPPR